MRLLLASANEHKRRELETLLAPHELDGLPTGFAMPEETGTTFTANALIKAHAAAQAFGRVTVADDSGIEAAALGGAPGVRSARYAGEDATDGENLAKLIAEAPVGSALRYVCVIAHVDPATGAEHLFEGACSGTMTGPRGDGGFGYDPVFLPDDLDDGRTMAELPADEKDRISHRGRAAARLMAWLNA